MKTVVITGGSDGLGKALAEALSKSYRVAILARNEQRMQAIGEAVGCDWYVCDVKDPKQIEEAFDKIIKRHGSVDVLINNAGIVVNGELVDTSNEDISNVINTNTLGSIYAAKVALRHMKARKEGLIINVVSQSGLKADARRSVYNASKWALTGFTKALQQEAAEYGVRVTGFYPGTLKTELFAKAGIEVWGSALEVSQAVKAVEFIMSADDEVLVPELGIKPAGF